LYLLLKQRKRLRYFYSLNTRDEKGRLCPRLPPGLAVSHSHGIRLVIWYSRVRTPAASGNLWPWDAKKNKYFPAKCVLKEDSATNWVVLPMLILVGNYLAIFWNFLTTWYGKLLRLVPQPHIPPTHNNQPDSVTIAHFLTLKWFLASTKKVSFFTPSLPIQTWLQTICFDKSTPHWGLFISGLDDSINIRTTNSNDLWKKYKWQKIFYFYHFSFTKKSFCFRLSHVRRCWPWSKLQQSNYILSNCKKNVKYSKFKILNC